MNLDPSWWPGLSDAAASAAGVSAERVRELLRASDVSFAPCGAVRRSSLNNDGTPVQLCVAVRRGVRSSRLLMDPAHEEPDPVHRCGRALAACQRLLTDSDRPAFSARLIRALWDVLPDREALARWLPRGALWLAIDLQGFRLAAYVSARWGEPSGRWDRVLDWLRASTPRLHQALAPVAARSEPASVALEGESCDDLRVKVYFRLLRPTPLRKLSLPGLLSPETEWFLASALEGRAVRRSGLLLSAYESLEGNRMGSKVDLCAHCVQRSPAEWAGLLERLAGGLGLADPEVSALLRERRAETAFVGFDGSRAGSPQLNIYLKAPGST